MFVASGCAACHQPRMTTGRLEGWPELSGQTIRPYTDLLLHDMGPGLADGVAEGRAAGSEWRTPPLWGLGLLAIVSGDARLLHDGRARSPEEAVRWHGGEAAGARRRFLASSRADRDALMAFLDRL
ncbi:MAG: di-heme oxidoredictase family protein [Vicinamibacterales bacterium]